MVNTKFILLAFLLMSSFSFVLAEQTGQYDGGIVVDQDNPNGNISIEVGPSGGGSSSYCGDGAVNLVSEYCDGSDLNSQTCASYMGSSYVGSLSCTSQCTFNTGACTLSGTVNPPGDGGTGGAGGTGGSGGSGGSSASCAENWVCTEWNTCKNGVQSRTCSDSKKCGTTKIKPLLQRDCTVEGANGEAGVGGNSNEEDQNGFSSIFTGAFLGTTAGKWSVGVIIFLILVGLAWWIVAWKKRSSDDKPVKVVKLSQMKKK